MAAAAVRIGPAAEAGYMGKAEAGSTVLAGVDSEAGPAGCRTPIEPSEYPTAIGRSGRGGLSREGGSVHNGYKASGIREGMSATRRVPMRKQHKSVADARRQAARNSA
jgi:hypothetical protein